MTCSKLSTVGLSSCAGDGMVTEPRRITVLVCIGEGEGSVREDLQPTLDWLDGGGTSVKLKVPFGLSVTVRTGS